VLCMNVAGHKPTQRYTKKMIDTVNSVLSMTGSQARVSVKSLHSTIGRHAARAVRAAVLHDALLKQWDALVKNIGKGDYETYNKPVFPKGEVRGVGIHEAPRGVLSHWIVIQDGKIKNYQCVVPSTWNAGPRNNNDEPGPYEASLLGNPIADPEKPLEVLRTVHSFDPCLACAIHMVDTHKNQIVKVRAF
jgi:hydrogenase large subunit